MARDEPRTVQHGIPALPGRGAGAQVSGLYESVGDVSMEEEEFKFKTDVDMNAVVKKIAESMAAQIGVKAESVQCKGVRIFFVEKESQMLMSSGLFIKGFDPEDWDD